MEIIEKRFNSVDIRSEIMLSLIGTGRITERLPEEWCIISEVLKYSDQVVVPYIHPNKISVTQVCICIHFYLIFPFDYLKSRLLYNCLIIFSF